MRKAFLSMIATCMIFAPGVHAQGIPTFDVSNIVQTTITARNSIEQVIEARRRYDQLVREFNSISGARNIGDVFNSPILRDVRRQLPNDFGSIVVGTGSNEFQIIYNAKKNAFEIVGGSVYDNTGVLQRGQAFHDHTTGATIGAAAGAEVLYQQSENNHLLIEKLVGDIQSSPDMKTSTDTMAILVAENAKLQNEAIRLQALVAQMEAAALAEEQRGNEQWAQLFKR